MADFYFKCTAAVPSGAQTGQYSWGSTTNWYNVSGVALNAIPTATDNVFFDSNSATSTQVVTLQTASRPCLNLNMTGFAGSMSGGNGGLIQVYGTSVILTSNSSVGIFALSTLPTLQIYSGTTTYIKTNGQTLGAVSVANTSTLTPIDDFISFSNCILTIEQGTFNANNKNVSIGGFSAGSTLASKTLTMGTGKWTLGGEGPPTNAFYVWNVSSSVASYLTLNAGTQSIRLVRFSGASALNDTLLSTKTTGDTIAIHGAIVQGSNTTTWGTTGTVLIDNEYITYTNLTVTDRSNVTLTIGSRGVNNTSVVQHNVGAAVLLIESEVTKLTAALDSSSTTGVTVEDTSQFGGGQNNGTILIDNETISYSTIPSSTSFTGISRGTAYGAAATEHKNGAKVYAVQARIFLDGAKSYPPIELWSTGAYYITNFDGNGTSSGGGISNISYNNLGSNQVRYGTYASPTTTYYQNKPQSGASSGDFFDAFWYGDRA